MATLIYTPQAFVKLPVRGDALLAENNGSVAN
jgi:hypothetical protein